MVDAMVGELPPSVSQKYVDQKEVRHGTPVAARLVNQKTFWPKGAPPLVV